MKLTLDVKSAQFAQQELAQAIPKAAIPKVATLVSLCFESRNLTHKAHLNVSGPGSYAAHKALEDYYSSIVGLVDTFVEAYQGRFGVIQDYPPAPLLAEGNFKNPVGILEELLTWMDGARVDCAPTPDLQNLYDGIANQITKSLYLLKNLA